MTKFCLSLLLAFAAVASLPAAEPHDLLPPLPKPPPLPAPFISKNKCECVGDYKPKKGVFRMYRVKLRKEWETRYYCNTYGGGKNSYGGKTSVVDKQPYRVLVTTYRERYSDGTQRVWKCVHSGTEVVLAK